MVNSDNKRRFLEAYEKEADALFRFVFLRVSNREEALDITSDTFAKLWEAMQKGPEIRSPRAFIFAVARNKIIDWYRKLKPTSLESMMEDDEENSIGFQVKDERAQDDIILGAEGRIVLEALNKVSGSYREIIYLRFVESLEPKEIAEILKMSPNAVSIRINRGIEELRKILMIDK